MPGSDEETHPDLERAGRPVPLVVLHERKGTWTRQLRARLRDEEANWAETRSSADLLAAIAGVGRPIVVMEAGHDPIPALRDLGSIVIHGSGPFILLIDPHGRPEVVQAARDLGSTLAIAGDVAPPRVADLVARWLRLASRRIDAEGWSRPAPLDPARSTKAWIDVVVAEAARAASASVPDASDDRDR